MVVVCFANLWLTIEAWIECYYASNNSSWLTHKWSTIWSTHINQNEQQRFNFNVLTHGAMGEMVLAERLELPTARLQIGCSTN